MSRCERCGGKDHATGQHDAVMAQALGGSTERLAPEAPKVVREGRAEAFTAAELDNFERHARDAGAGVCTLEASELLEFVVAYRCIKVIGELLEEVRS